ncbi:MAG: tRNA (adenosine(37)-N6)-threonylcarbamoyltransferase complex ATPase subunit type 1 TsaE [Chitinophagales bacterium]|nr:tRNA (adenosine(37)-N6)-threonylcarbamoyltransferase complex ATPase subunit type 1 TsaE [Bacteroidota bacterium]MBK9507211.1 tRNA (adenosine(37)-N6)-threonylcarbamoyltransferase complex ATPase subunit type 1 TsaE [Bacteroidota bacterium]MBK9554848.1 tRNA (adenosine(37)-N6)-threonylcarbamoyltransferase complex ATPase subunit type 1 TsaE [Bacteroidota bacterium]MBP8249207.1 tRNA (adenosine(37)-N6)-threonylcarbamoyltransferase complex ATPase subunit type 1 TsaE [Chitinophagales bacterium]MBP988
MEQTWLSHSVDDLPQIAEELINAISPLKKIAFYGQMGAGKTTFIKTICSTLGVTEPTSSPTFSIVNEYTGKSKIFHFDLFRINNPAELQEIGFIEYLENNDYVFIEWPEIIEPIFEDYQFVQIHITTIAAQERKIQVSWNNIN